MHIAHAQPLRRMVYQINKIVDVLSLKQGLFACFNLSQYPSEELGHGLGYSLQGGLSIFKNNGFAVGSFFRSVYC
jgi:hypothetical protein